MAEDTKSETLDLSRRGLKKIDKAPAEASKTIINLILDQNELQRLDNIETYTRIENLSICNNFLLRMHGVSRLTNIRVLSLNNNGILQIEGLKDLLYLKVLKLAGNNIKSIEHLNHNMHLEHLDLSNNQIAFIADISYLKSLKHLSVERNRIVDLRQCDRYLPSNLEYFGLANNNIQDLNEISHLVHLNNLDHFTIQGNPCVAMAGKDKLGFDYRPFVLNWIMSVKSIDGFVVSAIESLKAEWLYSQGKGRHFHSGQQQELCEYLASTCPLTADALETEDQRKLRLILSKAQHHQQQLKDQNHSPNKPKMQSPRMQSRIAARHMGRSPDRLTSSFHGGFSKSQSPSHQMSSSYSGDIMTQSLDSSSLGSMRERNRQNDKENERVNVNEPSMKPVNHSLEAASKMVPVPESLMSPDYQDPIYDIQRTIPKPNSNNVSNASSHSSNSSLQEDRVRHTTPPSTINKNFKGSTKVTKSPMSSPKFKPKQERKSSLTKDNVEERRMNGIKEKDDINSSKVEINLVSNLKKHKRLSVEAMAAVTIQKMWRGYRSRNLNKDTLRILHAIQAARARQHIQRLTCDMEATKAALESERKIQQLQMQAINALWKKVSTLQAAENQKQRCSESEDNTEVLRQLTETCFNLQTQVVELQSCMREVLGAVSHKNQTEFATQTDITAVVTPQEERCTWLKRPQTLTLTNSAVVPAPAQMSPRDQSVEKTEEVYTSIIDCPGTVTEEKDSTEKSKQNDAIVD